MSIRRSAVLVVLVFVVASSHWVVAEDLETQTREFDLRPSLDEALIAQIAENELDLATNPLLRQQRAAALIMPAMEPEGGGGGGSTAAEKRPGNWLVGGFDKTSKWVTLGTFVALGGYFVAADDEQIKELGDITQMIPLTAALGLGLGARDWQGLKQLGLAGGTSFVLTHGIKEVAQKTRPDTSGNNSFPSGHTSASVTGAAFIWRRYGPKWGAPASLFATYTGLSRVVGDKHFMDDVLSGAAIGLISNWMWTDPIDERVLMALYPTKGGAGVNFTVDPLAPKTNSTAYERWGQVPTRFFMWEIGGAEVTQNNVVAPNPGGTPIDFQFDEENDPTTTAFIALNWSNEKGQYDLFGAFAPFEIREVVELEEDLVFGGVTIPAGTSVQTRYISYDYRAGFDWAVINKPGFRLLFGGSAAVLYTEVGLAEEEGVDVSRSTTVVRPMIDGSFDWAFANKWLLFGGVGWWGDSDVTIFDASAQVGFRLHPKWTLSLGYRLVERSVKEQKLYTNMDRNQIALGVFYGW